MIIFYIISFILSLMLIFYHWRRRHLYFLSWSLNGSYSLPILGDSYKLMCKPEDVLETALRNITSAYPSPIKFWFGPKFSVAFTEISHVEKIITSAKFIQKGDIYLLLREYQGEGLITSTCELIHNLVTVDKVLYLPLTIKYSERANFKLSFKFTFSHKNDNLVPKWKRDHRLIAPYLTNKQTEKYFPCFLESSETLAKILETKVNQPKFNIKKYIARCSGEIVFETILGMNLGTQENGDLDMILKNTSFLYVHLHERMFKFWLHYDFVYTMLGCKERGQKVYQMLIKVFYDGLDDMKKIHEKEEYLDEKTSNKSLLNRLLYIRDKHPDFATDKEIIDHLSALYSAAEDTITIITCFALTVLGMYPEIQNKVYAELRSIFGDTPRSVTMEDLNELHYLKMCVKDVLRLFPIAPFILRTAMEEVKIEKWVIPKDCMIILSIFNIHRDPTLWERPNDFYPEHFLPEAVAKRHPYAFLAFSAGPRACVGRSFAYKALYTILATLLQRFEFISEGKLQDKKLKCDITTRYKDDDYSVRIIPRKQI